MESEWWKQYFPIAANAQIEAALTRENVVEAAWVAECLGLKSGDRVLDVPCGEGRLARELARRGCHVVGVDIEAKVIAAGRERAQQQKLKIAFEQCDMRDLQWVETFDGAFCYFGSFGYFDDAENERFVRAVHRALKPGAKFLIETHCMETLLPVFTARGWHQEGQTIILQDRHLDVAAGRINAEWTFIEPTGVSKSNVSIRLYTYRELVTLFETAGFAACQGFDTASHGAFNSRAKRLTFVGRK